MPKIEVNEELFFSLAGKKWNKREEFEEALSCAKAELDEDSDKSLPVSERTLKIELNDTNRPDLWGTAGCARQLRVYHTGKTPVYPFFSSPGNMKEARKRVIVEETVQAARPFLAGFIAKGRLVSDASLRDMIQTQEKLAWNYGRKRRTVSMGIYRSAAIKWPVHYRAVDPDSVSFIPLQWDSPLTLSEILKQHPKGKEYGFIQEGPLHPLLVDAAGKVLSYPPIINSADLGAVQVGDSDLFIELTGTDIAAVTLCASIAACDLADQGYEIEPVELSYEYETPFGKNWTSPFYFQNPIFCSQERIERFLGEKIAAKEAVTHLARMGCRAEKIREAELGSAEIVEGVRLYPPEYRNDFLHAADVVEDVMIGRSLSSFSPEFPHDFTIGRLSALTVFSRKTREILAGLGYQEMIYNYLGSKKDLIDNMRGDGVKIIRIENPMTENYEYVRDSILPCLCASESVSANAGYPHKIFELGKVVYRDESKNYGCSTRQFCGILHAATDANFNTVAAQIRTLFYYLSREYTAAEVEDKRFIPGRAAQIIYKGKSIGIFGEIHPEVLENWGITSPAAAAEFDLDVLLSTPSQI
ncbi:MAG: phenylalanine--tRNA ligase subunit beta [Spirochaetaceae bacterium]|jgi:phenylalanyl-tRNA synthetase beta chain|nr:phenylalanine--tRNA ligase subunit beta [Spirochaetaceae bacterium]